MRRTANSRTRLELHAQRCNSRGGMARTLSWRISINRSRCMNSGFRTELLRNSAKRGSVVSSIYGGEAASQLIAQDFENVRALADTLQYVCARAAAECNDVFNCDQRRLCVNRCGLGLFLARFLGLDRV